MDVLTWDAHHFGNENDHLSITLALTDSFLNGVLNDGFLAYDIESAALAFLRRLHLNHGLENSLFYRHKRV